LNSRDQSLVKTPKSKLISASTPTLVITRNLNDQIKQQLEVE